MVELFKVGFLTVTLSDIIDISIVAFIFYKLYSTLRGTVASQIFVGLLIILFISFIAQLIHLRAVSWLLKLITDVWVLAFVILFQPEIRRILVLLARNPVIKNIFRVEANFPTDIIVDAVFELSQHQHGALIVLIKSSGIRGFAETGELLNARLTKSLLTSIFFPRSPLHDGAVVIKGDIIEAARVTLPLSQFTKWNDETLGMRHRAGLGISEQADVLCLIVSEETGSISVAENGVLEKGFSKQSLKDRINTSVKYNQIQNWKNIFDNFKKK